MLKPNGVVTSRKPKPIDVGIQFSKQIHKSNLNGVVISRNPRATHPADHLERWRGGSCNIHRSVAAHLEGNLDHVDSRYRAYPEAVPW